MKVLKISGERGCMTHTEPWWTGSVCASRLISLAVSNDAEADISNVERVVFWGVHHMVRMHVGSRGGGGML